MNDAGRESAPRGRLGWFAVSFAVCVALASAVPSVPTSEQDVADQPSGETDAGVAGPARIRVHDTAADLVVDRVVRSDGAVRIVGWAIGANDVEVIADGTVIGALPVIASRPDVSTAQGLASDLVGFDGSVPLPPGTHMVCVARAGRLPGPSSCDPRTLDLPAQRVVAYYGIADDPALGTLGDGSPADALARLLRQIAPYERADRPVVPAFEAIATVAQAAPGADGDYSAPVDVDDLWRLLRTIRRAAGVLVLDIQPGRASYMDQLPPLEELLAQPDVHLALDPEWDMGPGEVPAQVVGSTSAADIGEVMDWLDDLVAAHHLPRKLLIVQNFQPRMITGRDHLDPPDTVTLSFQMDGHAPPADKIGNYERLRASPPILNGFKLFYQRDVPLMSPADVLALDPPPDYISYQ